MTKPVSTIFLDMDGVCCQFAEAVARLFGQEGKRFTVWNIENQLGITTERMWEEINTRGSAFWEDLEPYPWAERLYSQCLTVAPTRYLTSPGLHPASLVGKLEWLYTKHYHGFPYWIMARDKTPMATPGALLIDDSVKNVQAFRLNGGRALVFPRPWNLDTPQDPSDIPEPLRPIFEEAWKDAVS